jgi:DNA polymerase-1
MSGGGASAAQTAAQTAARGRYGRNALIQGAAAELFKMWAVTVRARGASLGARIVLCLHDELLVHVPEDHAPAAARLVSDCLEETARRWAPGRVRFLADISAVRCWADAKPTAEPARADPSEAESTVAGPAHDGPAEGRPEPAAEPATGPGTVTASISSQEGA